MADASTSETNGTAAAGSGAKYYVMPERFLPLTRSAALPAASVAAPASAVPMPAPVSPSTPRPPESSPPPAPPSVSADPFAPIPTGAASPPGTPETPAAIPPDGEDRRRKLLLGGGILLVVLLAAGITSYFLLRAPKPPPPPAANTAKPPSATPPQPKPAPVNTPTVPPVVVPPAPVVPVVIPVPEPEPVPIVNAPPPLPSDDVDVDGDGMSEAEERAFGTDPTRRDTDADGYADTLELVNLYNPSGIAPERLVDAGLVYEYEHPTDHWSVYVPKGWSVASGTRSGVWEIRDGSGVAVVGVELLENASRMAVDAWLRKQSASVDSAVAPVSTRRGASGYQLTETQGSTYFALTATRILHLRAADEQSGRKYPNLFPLVLQSLRMSTRGSAR